MRGLNATAADRLRRFVLPGLAFKAVVIGGGYATGRELAEFFLPAGPWGGVLAMLLATLIWSVVAAATFRLAHAIGAHDYRTFFQALLGRGWVAFEAAYALFIVVVLAIFGAAAGEIGAAVLGVQPLVGTLALLIGIVVCVAWGNASVERVFLWVSVLLYATYALFLVLAVTNIGHRIEAAFATTEGPGAGWALGGVTYAGYNIVGAVIVLPVTRHIRSGRDAVIAGAIAGPLAMLPALLFFVCMTAFLPEIASAVLPSDYMLVRLGHPLFHLGFQLMIFAALLESGTGAVHAVNERIARARGRADLLPGTRALLALALLAPCMLLAERVGLVGLIAGGYRLLAALLILVYVVPLLVATLLRRGAVGHLIPKNLPGEPRG
ncbi:YkvI family membrane protein [Sphingomonas trueperi]|uniref:YkvI family membrane protein n=1 Tax=Sphingomonas trueperi TaxID=53317 RepID=UPI000EAE1E3A